MLFTLRPSVTYVLMLLTVHLLAGVCIFLSNLPLWARLSILLLIVFSLLYELYRQKQSGWRSFSLNHKHVSIKTAAGLDLEGELAPQTLVTIWCVVLCVRRPEQAFPACQVIFPDAMQADAFRELRVRLRFS
jgi:hypothetical protein